jgi:hypothetical protein
MNPENTDKEKYETRGKFGQGTIERLPDGSRQVRIEFWNGRAIAAESQRVDLEEAKAESLQEAVEKACHAVGFLPLFEKIVISGPKALVNCYRRPSNPSQGWASVIKRGTTPIRFALSRIDLFAMKSQTIEEALRKVAFDSGKITIHSS